jgi:hypothetical protein
MMLPFEELAITTDELTIAAVLLVVMLGGMRLLYGAWPWEASKTWYRTRQAVAYVEVLRGEKKRGPAPQLVPDAADNGSDSFDRSLTVNDQSPPEVAPPEGPPASGQPQKSKRVRRRWRKSSQMHPTSAETSPLTTGGSDGGDEADDIKQRLE